jgi:hypothetical protein
MVNAPGQGDLPSEIEIIIEDEGSQLTPEQDLRLPIDLSEGTGHLDPLTVDTVALLADWQQFADDWARHKDVRGVMSAEIGREGNAGQAPRRRDLEGHDRNDC